MESNPLIFTKSDKGLTLAKGLPFRQIDLFCTCLMPDTYGDMVACDECERWYHIKCVKLQQCPKEEEKWTCKDCSKILICNLFENFLI